MALNIRRWTKPPRKTLNQAANGLGDRFRRPHSLRAASNQPPAPDRLHPVAPAESTCGARCSAIASRTPAGDAS